MYMSATSDYPNVVPMQLVSVVQEHAKLLEGIKRGEYYEGIERDSRIESSDEYKNS